MRMRIMQTSEASVHNMGVRIHAKRPSFPILSLGDDSRSKSDDVEEAVNTSRLYV
jgi:hypothetical protein